MASVSADLEILSKKAGIDLVAIKEKYKNMAAKPSTGVNTHQQQSSKKTDTSALNNYKLCPECQGVGTVKTIYNHMVMEKDCAKCDGECVLMTVSALAQVHKDLSPEEQEESKD